MGDSDDEYNSYYKRGRDKFQRERRDESNHHQQMDEKKDFWKYKSNYQTYSYQDRQNHQNNSPPPQKRRKEWGDSSGVGGDSKYAAASGGDSLKETNNFTQPPYVSFKRFLQQQDDSINEEEAIKKYNNYRVEFKKAQINQFFLSHKAEDWFKSRYYPDDSEKRFNEQKNAIKSRLDVFIDFYKKGFLDSVSVEEDKSTELIRFLDSTIIKMEGGSDADLKCLNSETNSNSNEEEKQSNGGVESSEDSNQDSEDGATKSNRSKKQQPAAKALHKNCSIFLRNLPSSVNEKDIESILKELDVPITNVKRIALSDPCPERGFFRRGWITCESNVNVKSLCWSLNNRKIKGFNPAATVNRDLTKRVRPSTHFICHHKPCVQNDIKLARKIVEKFDDRWSIDWSRLDDENHKNPLISEVKIEQEDSPGIAAGGEESNDDEIQIEEDLELKKALDKLILYLRVVYSFDFYNNIEYQQEDLMPNRCGIIHARAPISSNLIRKSEIKSYNASVEANMKPFIEYNDKLDEETAKKLGLKDKEEEIEKFVEKNTVQLAADRWLCPLSGKKFKGAEFIKKHLFYKHEEKIEEVKKEVDFFNNFLFDPKRPQLPEHPSNRSGVSSVNNNNSNRHQNPVEFNKFPLNNFFYAGHEYPANRLRNLQMNSNSYEANSGATRHSRAIITYKDLDSQMDG